VELRLVADDVPIRGRILDTQGRPISGVNVRVGTIEEPPPGDLDALFSTGTIQEGRFSARFANAAWWTKEGNQWVKKTIQTGPDGRFQIDGAGRDRLILLEFDGPGIESGRLWAMTRVAPPSAKPYPLHGASFDHVAGASRPIEGVVRLKGTDRPLAGVHVSVFVQQATAAHARAITDKDGRFRLDGLPKVASYKVHASPRQGQPYLPASTVVADTPGLKPIPVTLEMLKGIVVRVRLIDKATGKPVAVHSVQHVKLPSNRNEGQASIYATNPGPEEFLMTVPPGPGFFYARAEGKDLPYTRARITPADRGRSEGISDFGDGGAIQIILSPCHTYRIVDVPAHVEMFNLDMELTRGASRKGRLIDPEGKPVSGVIVYGLAANWQVKTLDDETFEVVGLEPGKPRTVSFIHKDRRLAGAVLLEPGESPVEVRLTPCGAAVGRLVDGDGQPLAGATIHLTPLDHRGQMFPGNVGLWPEGDVFTADKDGRFRVGGINPALSAHLAVNPRSRPDVFLMPEKSKAEILKHLKARPGETVDLGEIRLTR
jgi:Carboxypeptidase regulatory-like domain